MSFKTLCLLSALVATSPAFAQQAAAPAPAVDDTPSFKVGVTFVGDFTFQDEPETVDSEGNRVHASSFNVTRGYINVTGNLNHWINYRITPDIARETGTGSSLNGSYDFRMKFAYAQFNLDDWTTKGSWVRFGVHQTPYVDYTEGVYRYRFQGPVFAERTGLLVSSDGGISGRYVLPSNYGDVHAGIYNGEGFSRAEANDQKGFMIRGSFRPAPASATLKGLRVTGFVDSDAYLQDRKRQRIFEQVTYEHPRVTVGAEAVQASDETTAAGSTGSSGFSVWATPKLGKGWELLLRHDEYDPNDDLPAQSTERTIAGIAWWVPNLNKMTAAFLLDMDQFEQRGFTPARPDERRFAVRVFLNY